MAICVANRSAMIAQQRKDMEVTMARRRIHSITEIKHGTALVCPESLSDETMVVKTETNFWINRDGFWGVECAVCGENHTIGSMEIKI